MQRVKAARGAFHTLRFSFTVGTTAVANQNNLEHTYGSMVMQALSKYNVGWSNVYINLMAFDFQDLSSCALDGSGKGCDMVQSAINAAESLHSLSDVPYSNIEPTVMIRQDDHAHMFTVGNVAALTAYVRSKSLAGLHFWSFYRDTDCPPAVVNGCQMTAVSATCNSYGSAGKLGFTNKFVQSFSG